MAAFLCFICRNHRVSLFMSMCSPWLLHRHESWKQCDLIPLQGSQGVKNICVLAKFWVIQVLCNLIFAISCCAFCYLSPSPSYYKASKVILTITVNSTARHPILCSHFLHELLLCLLCNPQPQGHCTLKRYGHLRSHKAAETSTTAVGTALPGLTRWWDCSL